MTKEQERKLMKTLDLLIDRVNELIVRVADLEPKEKSIPETFNWTYKEGQEND